MSDIWDCRAWLAEQKRAKYVYELLCRRVRGGDTQARMAKRSAAGIIYDLARGKAEHYCEAIDAHETQPREVCL